MAAGASCNLLVQLQLQCKLCRRGYPTQECRGNAAALPHVSLSLAALQVLHCPMHVRTCMQVPDSAVLAERFSAAAPYGYVR